MNWPCAELLQRLNLYNLYTQIPQAFHQCFLEYLKTGTIETEPPARVDVTLVEREGSRYPQFTFSGMTDNTAVAQTNLYKNGTLYDYIVPSVKVGGNASQNVWVDYDYTEGEQVYEVECVDVCGNVSEKRSFTVDVSNLTQGNTQQLTTEPRRAALRIPPLSAISYRADKSPP